MNCDKVMQANAQWSHRGYWVCVLLVLSITILPTLVNGESDNRWPWLVAQEGHGHSASDRVKRLGPLYESSKPGNNEEKSWTAVRPLTLKVNDDNAKSRDDYFLYPLYSQHKSDRVDRWNIFQIVRSLKVKGENGEDDLKAFSIFPFWFSRDTGKPENSYKGLFPIRGMVRNFLGFDVFSWTLFPLKAELKKGEETRHSMPWPFIQWQTGPKSKGFGIWPLFGHFEKEGVYDHQYMFWPFTYYNRDKLDKKYPTTSSGFLPFYAKVESENVESLTWAWPFFGYTKQKEPLYNESRYFWPLFVQGRGEERHINRWAPFYSYSKIHGREKTWRMWPFIREMKWQEQELAITQKQFLYFLAWNQEQRSLTNPDLPVAKVSHVWPLYSSWDNGAGSEQLQFLSPFGSIFPNDKIIRRKYSPLFAFYRFEKEGEDYNRQSLLFDFVVSEESKEVRKLSIGPLLTLENKTANEPGIDLFNGLFAYKHHENGKTLTLFWQDIIKSDEIEIQKDDELVAENKKECTEKRKKYSTKLAQQ